MTAIDRTETIQQKISYPMTKRGKNVSELINEIVGVYRTEEGRQPSVMKTGSFVSFRGFLI